MSCVCISKGNAIQIVFICIFCTFNSVLVDISATQSCPSCGMVVNWGTWPIIILPVAYRWSPSDKQFELKQWKSGEGQEPLGESSCPMRLYKEYKRQAFPICFTLSRFFYGFYYVQTFPFPPMSKKNCYQGESTWHIFVDKVSWSSLVL